MAAYEHWTDAYLRIKKEVEREFPEASDQERYQEYRKRVLAWKDERGIRR